MNILEIIESIARERRLEKEQVMDVMEAILLEHAIAKYGHNDNLRLKIHLDGSFEAFLEQKIVEEKTDNDFGVISLQEAKMRNPAAIIGGVINDALPMSIDKSDIEKIYHALCKRLTVIQKQKEYEAFRDLVGQNANGYIKRADLTEALIVFPNGEGILKKNHTLRGDEIKVGSYIKVNIKDVRENVNRQIFLSRTNNAFLSEIFKQEIPEIQNQIIEIKCIARDPGSLSKIAVHSTIPSINPISVCVGPHGSRIQAIIKELNGEKISLVRWSENKHEFIASALSPAMISRIVEVSPNNYLAVVEQDQFRQAMGRGGQNVILAKRLCGANSIKLITTEEETAMHQVEVNKAISDLTAQLEIEEMMAHLLISAGFNTAYKIAETTPMTLAQLEGFDEELAGILYERAAEYVKNETEKIKEQLRAAGKDSSLFDLYSLLGNKRIQRLISNDVCQKNELAMLDAYEIQKIFEDTQDMSMTLDVACSIISAARSIKERN
jgi:N utilization substance protein A